MNSDWKNREGRKNIWWYCDERFFARQRQTEGLGC